MVGLALILFAICCLVLLLLKRRNRRFLPYNPLTERRVRIPLTEENDMSDELVTLPDGDVIERLVRPVLESSDLSDTVVDTFIQRLEPLAKQSVTAEVLAGILGDRLESVTRASRAYSLGLLERITRLLIGDNNDAACQSAIAHLNRVN